MRCYKCRNEATTTCTHCGKPICRQHTIQKATRYGVQDFCPDCKDLTPDEETEYEVRQREYRKTRDERKKRRTVEMRRKKQVTVITVVFTVVMFAGIAAVIGMVGTRVINGFVSWPTVSIITAFGAALGLLDALKK